MTKDEVLKVHTDVFYAALTRQNYAALEELYSDDYMLVRPDGSVLNKQEVLQDLRSNGLRFHSIDPHQLVAKVYGSAGVVTGESRTVTSRNGVESRAHFRFIAVYSRVGDLIRLVHFRQDVGALSEPGQSWVGALEFRRRNQVVNQTSF
jgi:hypothetical protein